MEKRIERMYRWDFAAVVMFLAFLWMVLGYVLFALSKVITSANVEGVIVSIGILVGCYATLNLLVVINHLRGNKTELYLEEIKYSQKQTS